MVESASWIRVSEVLDKNFVSVLEIPPLLVVDSLSFLVVDSESQTRESEHGEK